MIFAIEVAKVLVPGNFCVVSFVFKYSILLGMISHGVLFVLGGICISGSDDRQFRVPWDGS